MTVYRLWEGNAPGAKGSGDGDVPTLTDYGQVAGPAKAACVICPGGAYAGLAQHEGHPVALWLEKVGVRAFVLKYRLGPKYKHPIMLGDAQRAIRYVRAHTGELGVDPLRVGILGFSAGGHLASTASTHFALGDPHSADPVERQASHPDWSVLIYPVIEMMGPYAHAYSREMLLGKSPSQADLESLSNARVVSLNTPPTFICHGADDTAVPVQNSLEYAAALAGHKIPFELYVPQNGEHGFGLGYPGSEQDWTGLCERWLKDRAIAS
jgi:acetyl esterase/lipase